MSTLAVQILRLYTYIIMNLPELNDRDFVAMSFDGGTNKLDLNPRTNNLNSELVRSVVKANYLSKPLADIKSDDDTDLARAWRFVIPSPEHSTGLTVTQFAHSTLPLTGENNTQAAIAHVRLMNLNLQMNYDNRVSVRELYKTVGGDVAQEVAKSGDLFFAGLEQRYRVEEPVDGSEPQLANWSQLVYSRKLFKTTDILQRAIQMRKARNVQVPSWMEKAALPKNRRATASAMALSALAAFENMNE